MIKINHAGTQVTRWDTQNKATRTIQDWLSFHLDAPLRNLRPSMADFVSCDLVIQRAYCGELSSHIKITLNDNNIKKP